MQNRYLFIDIDIYVFQPYFRKQFKYLKNEPLVRSKDKQHSRQSGAIVLTVMSLTFETRLKVTYLQKKLRFETLGKNVKRAFLLPLDILTLVWHLMIFWWIQNQSHDEPLMSSTCYRKKLRSILFFKIEKNILYWRALLDIKGQKCYWYPFVVPAFYKGPNIDRIRVFIIKAKNKFRLNLG